MFFKIGVIKIFLQNSQKNTCARVSFLRKFIKKETLAQVFYCDFYQIFMTTFFHRTSPVAATEKEVTQTQCFNRWVT